jgi:hypothetical protein
MIQLDSSARQSDARVGTGTRRSRRFNVLTEWCIRRNSTPSAETMVKRAQARAPGAFELNRSGYGTDLFTENKRRDAEDAEGRGEGLGMAE